MLINSILDGTIQPGKSIAIELIGVTESDAIREFGTALKAGLSEVLTRTKDLAGNNPSGIFEISNLNAMFHQIIDEKGNFVSVRDCFSGMPPYETTWFEFIEDGIRYGVLVTVKKLAPGDIVKVPRFATVMETNELDKLPLVHNLGLANNTPELNNMLRRHSTHDGIITVQAPAILDKKTGQIQPHSDTLENTGLYCDVSPDYVIHVQPMCHDETFDREGLICEPSGSIYGIDAQGNFLFRPFMTTTASADIEFTKPERNKLFLEALRMMTRTHQFFLALNFLACKNISTRKILPDPKLNKARLRRGKQPLSAFSVLDLTSGITGRSASNKDNADPDYPEATRKRLHAVRGHFAEYKRGESPGLFGKLFGRFWIPAHVRGDAEQGTKAKTYKV